MTDMDQVLALLEQRAFRAAEEEKLRRSVEKLGREGLPIKVIRERKGVSDSRARAILERAGVKVATGRGL